MPYAVTDDGIRIYYEETGSGKAVVFVHEFSGDYRSWELQMRYFGQLYHTIAFNARGYPPSDVPEEISKYSQNRAADDIVDILNHLCIERAHIVGLSMGGYATLHFGFRHPTRAISLTVAGCGHGADPSQREVFQAEAEKVAAVLKSEGMTAYVEKYTTGPTRVQLRNKDPRGFAEFKRLLQEHSPLGMANTQLGCLRERPSLYDLVDEMKALTVPTLILAGDEDWPCVTAGVMMKRQISTAALAVMPNCGHRINLEETGKFNAIVGDFLRHVDSGNWQTRDPHAG
jgi:pimeloyl-ACP methyl ester carboxylesterase